MGSQNLLFGNTKGRSQGMQQSQSMPESRKRDATNFGGAESSCKRRKSTPIGTPSVGNSRPTLTTVEAATLEEPMEDFQQHAIIQQNFCVDHKQCFFFY